MTPITDCELRPRLDGLTDEEYLWAPVEGAWNVHVAGDRVSDRVSIDLDYPEPRPTSVTTVARRIAHVVVGVFGARNAAHFGVPSADYESWQYAVSKSIHHGAEIALLRDLYAHRTD